MILPPRLRNKQRGFIMNPYRYASGDTPPGPVIDPHFDNVMLLLHMDGADGSTTFVDSSLQGNAVTAVSTAVDTAIKLFGTGSGEFVGGYLSISGAAACTNFNGKGRVFSIETTIIPAANLDSSTPQEVIFSKWNTGQYCYLLDYAGGSVRWIVSGDSTNTSLLTVCGFAMDLTAGVQYRIGVFADGTNYYLTVNGVLVRTVAVGATDIANTPLPLFMIGQKQDGTFGSSFKGHIDEFRITHYVARHSADYSLDTEEFPNEGPTETDPDFDKVVYLLSFDDYETATTVKDFSLHDRTANIVQHSGTPGATLRGDIVKFGARGLYTSGDFYPGNIEFPASDDFYLGNQDFAFEYWLRPAAAWNPSTSRLWYVNTDVYTGFSIGVSNTGQITVYATYYGSNWDLGFTSSAALAQLVWQYLKIYRKGGSLFCQINDSIETITTGLGTTAIWWDPGPRVLGGQSASPYRCWNGAIDECRMSVGVHREGPMPTKPFPRSGP